MSGEHTQPVRLGFLGTGWIGRHRMQAVLDSGLAIAAAVADPDPACLDQATELAPQAARCPDLDALLDLDLDGVVIATPSASHAAQSIQALQRGMAVFCQKPLGRDHDEVAAVVAAAASCDRLLGVDLSYRHLKGMAQVRSLIQDGALGRIYAVQSAFHNAYGPDKEWFYQRALSGGGCLIDLGVHLIDLALWLLGHPTVEGVTGRCFTAGEPLSRRPQAVEDYATARLDLAGNIAMDLACSWKLPLGTDAEILLRIFGSDGAISLRNINGSFYDFVIEHVQGQSRTTLAEPPDAWGGKALISWTEQLRTCAAYDPSIQSVLEVSQVLDRIYADAAQQRP